MGVSVDKAIDLDGIWGLLCIVREEQAEAKKREAKRDADQAIRDGVLESLREILTETNASLREIVANSAQADEKAAGEDRLGKALALLESLPARTAEKTIALLEEGEKDEGSAG